jgi:hypothetical protein
LSQKDKANFTFSPSEQPSGLRKIVTAKKFPLDKKTFEENDAGFEFVEPLLFPVYANLRQQLN